jgi:hypothetical protein
MQISGIVCLLFVLILEGCAFYVPQPFTTSVFQRGALDLSCIAKRRLFSSLTLTARNCKNVGVSKMVASASSDTKPEMVRILRNIMI